MNQQEMELRYSRNNIKPILKQQIMKAADTLLIDFMLEGYLIINEWLEYALKHSHESKQKRLTVLKAQLSTPSNLDSLLIDIAAAVLIKDEQTLQQVTGALESTLIHPNVFDRVLTIAEILAILSNREGLFVLTKKKYRKYHIISINPAYSEKMQDIYGWINTTLFNLPLIESPRKVINNRNCGYHSIREPLILGQFTQHDYYQDKYTIDILNSIQWVLDPHVLMEPELPTKALEPQEMDNFLDMVTESQFVYNLLKDNTFYLCWQYDSRGRMYCHGYHINFQGPEYKRALLSFNEYHHLTGE